MMEELATVVPVGLARDLIVPARLSAQYGEGYERYTSAVFRQLATRADVVVDIGAHVGYYSALALEANSDSRVVAVEASPENYEVLMENLAGFEGRVEGHLAIQGCRSGKALLQVTEASDNCSTTGHPRSPTLDTVEVDALVGESLKINGAKRLLVKVDVEGHELEVLEGMDSALGSAERVCVIAELNPKCLVAAGYDPQDLLEWLSHRGYVCAALDDDARRWRYIRRPDSWAEFVAKDGYVNIHTVRATDALSVAFVLHSAGLGGTERTHVEQVSELVADGALVQSVLPEAGELNNLLELAGSSVSIATIPWWPGMFSAKTSADHFTPPVSLLHPDLLETLSEAGPDVVVTRTIVTPAGALAAAVLGIPHVWSLHEFGDLDHGLSLPMPPTDFGRMVLELSEEVVTNSRAVALHFFETFEHVTTINPRPLLPVDQQAGRARGQHLLVMGSLSQGKGHADVIRALAILSDQGDAPSVLFIGEGSDQDRQRLTLLAQELGVSNLVLLPGGTGRAAEALAAAAMVVVPSRAEAFGRIPFEAARVGTPLVYTRAGGMIEYMEDEVTGLAYSPGDAAALADCISRLREDPGLGVRLARMSRERLLGVHGNEPTLANVLRKARRARLNSPARWLGAYAGAVSVALAPLDGV